MYKKMLFVPLAALSLTGCLFDNDNNSSRHSNGSSPSPSSSPAPSAAPTASASAAPTTSPSATPAPTTPSPSPTASTGPSPTPGNAGNASASGCFNPTLLTPGSNYKWTLRRQQSGGTPLTTTDDRTVATGNFTFNGQSAIKTVSNSTTLNGSSSSTDTFNNLNKASKQIETLGTLTSSPIAVTITFDPPRKDSFTLSKGQSESQSYQQTIKTGSFSTISQSITRKRTYLGRKTINVPAGQFATCHFKEETSFDGSNKQVVETWLDVGSGLLVQQRNPGDGDDKLVSGEVNGSPIQ